jgi:hypothetical protein
LRASAIEKEKEMPTLEGEPDKSAANDLFAEDDRLMEEKLKALQAASAPPTACLPLPRLRAAAYQYALGADAQPPSRLADRRRKTRRISPRRPGEWSPALGTRCKRWSGRLSRR